MVESAWTCSVFVTDETHQPALHRQLAEDAVAPQLLGIRAACSARRCASLHTGVRHFAH